MNKNIIIVYEVNRLNAINQYMGKKDVTLESELEGFMDKLYEKYVPQQVREFIEISEKEKPKQKTKKKNTTIENITNYG